MKPLLRNILDRITGGDQRSIRWFENLASATVPEGGTYGQVLGKAGNDDFDLKWKSVGSVATGAADLDFGGIPGGGVASAVVTGQANILPTTQIKVWMQADDGPDFNATEHALILAGRIGLTAGEIVAGVGFTIFAETELRLTGKITVRWEWS